MNKLLCLSIAALCLYVNDARAWISWEVGVKHGYNSTKFVGDHVNNTSGRKTGVGGGLFITTHFTDRFGVRVEGLYMQKGATDTLRFSFGSEVSTQLLDVTVELEYFEIPILGVITIRTWEHVILNAFGGPAVGFNTDAGRKIKTDLEDDEGNKKLVEHSGRIAMPALEWDEEE